MASKCNGSAGRARILGIDRNPRMPAPLAVNGRLFHQGLNRIIALDSYNGAVLWSLEIPALRRVNMPRDAGNWCADPDRLFVAVKDRCWVIAAGTGELLRTFPLADPGLRASHEWGYVARAGDLLYGSSVKQGAVYTNFWGKESWYDATSGQGTEKVCSDDLFALASESGELKWRYRGGVVINSTIGIAGGKVLFVECRHPEVAALATSRIGSPKLWENQYLVALDARTGDKLWDQADRHRRWDRCVLSPRRGGQGFHRVIGRGQIPPLRLQCGGWEEPVAVGARLAE